MRAAMHVVSDLRELLEHDTENVCELLGAMLREHASIGPINFSVSPTRDDGTALTEKEMAAAKKVTEETIREALRLSGDALGG